MFGINFFFWFVYVKASFVFYWIYCFDFVPWISKPSRKQLITLPNVVVVVFFFRFVCIRLQFPFFSLPNHSFGFNFNVFRHDYCMRFEYISCTY